MFWVGLELKHCSALNTLLALCVWNKHVLLSPKPKHSSPKHIIDPPDAMIAPSPVVDSAAAAVTAAVAAVAAAVAATAGVLISLACFQQATVPLCRPPLATDFPAFFFIFLLCMCVLWVFSLWLAKLLYMVMDLFLRVSFQMLCACLLGIEGRLSAWILLFICFGDFVYLDRCL